MRKIITLVALTLFVIIPQGAAAQVTGMENGHEWVDLGLPSGTLWATCNVGANSPEEYGYYFAWGETEPKDSYTWNTYKYCKGSDNNTTCHTLTKYCYDSTYGYHGFTDSKTTLDLEDDAAHANWGGNWCMPTADDFAELYGNTYNSVSGPVDNYHGTGVNVYRFMLMRAGKGQYIILPKAGYCGSSIDGTNVWGYYWCSTLDMRRPCDAYVLEIDTRVRYVYNNLNVERYWGHPVRPVIHPSDATGIKTTQTSAGQQTAPMYNLMGQKVDKSYKGIVIQNGRKFVR